MSCIVQVGGVGLHPDMLAGRKLFVLLPEPPLGIPNQELIEDLEVVGTIDSHHMGEELINDLTLNHKVMQQPSAVLLCGMLDEILVKPNNVVARWNSHNPGIPLATRVHDGVA